MGVHARPRLAIRSATIGAITAGAALTGVGLTAAAIDAGAPRSPGNALAIGPGYSSDPGLGSPVQVADVSMADTVTRLDAVSPVSAADAPVGAGANVSAANTSAYASASASDTPGTATSDAPGSATPSASTSAAQPTPSPTGTGKHRADTTSDPQPTLDAASTVGDLLSALTGLL